MNSQDREKEDKEKDEGSRKHDNTFNDDEQDIEEESSKDNESDTTGFSPPPVAASLIIRQQMNESEKNANVLGDVNTILTESSSLSSTSTIASTSYFHSQPACGINGPVSNLGMNRSNWNSNSNSNRKPPSRLRSIPIRAQINFLLTTTVASTLLFLFTFLNALAFTFFISSCSLLVLLFYTIYFHLSQLYENGELSLYPMLPESVQSMLEGSMHQFLTNSSFFLEWRFLLIYFIPGLTEEQLMSLINRLPERRRTFLMSPLSRMVAPERTSNVLHPVNASDTDRSLAIIQEEEEEQLPLSDVGIGEGHEEEITMLDFAGNLMNVATSIFRQPIERNIDTMGIENLVVNEVVPIESPAGVRSRNMSPIDMTLNFNEGNEQNTNSFDLVPAGILHPTVTHNQLTVSHSDPPVVQNNSASRGTEVEQHNQQQERTQSQMEQEQHIEERILSDAISTMSQNYTSSVSTAVANSAQRLADSLLTFSIRAGSILSSISSMGFLLYHPSLLGYTLPLAIMGRAQGVSSSQAVTRRVSQQPGERFLLTLGLFSVIGVGSVSVGIWLRARNRVRNFVSVKDEKYASDDKSFNDQE